MSVQFQQKDQLWLMFIALYECGIPKVISAPGLFISIKCKQYQAILLKYFLMKPTLRLDIPLFFPFIRWVLFFSFFLKQCHHIETMLILSLPIPPKASSFQSLQSPKKSRSTPHFHYSPIQQIFIIKLKQQQMQNTFQQFIIIKSKSLPMFQNYNFNLQTHANLDDADLTCLSQFKNLALDHYNCSPSSLQCSPQVEGIELEHSLDDSFEEGTQVDHAQNVWKASVQYLQKGQDGFSQNQKGFNDNSIYRSYNNSSAPAKAPLTEVIKSNRIFRAKEKKEFMEDLERETEVCGLLVEMMLLFNQNIFNQLVYVIYRIWSTKYLKFRNDKSNKESFLPSFSNFCGFESQEKSFGESTHYSESSSTSEVVQASSEGLEELAKQLFTSKRLKYLNLQEMKTNPRNKANSLHEFTQFVKSVSKAVFLSAEGIYQEEPTMIRSFSEQDEEESRFDTPNKFVRLFSQLQEDDEEYYPTKTPKKQIKLF